MPLLLYLGGEEMLSDRKAASPWHYIMHIDSFEQNISEKKRNVAMLMCAHSKQIC